MSAAPAASNSDKTLTSTPADNLSSGTTYKLRTTTSAKDTSCNTLASNYTTNGFTTVVIDATAPTASVNTATIPNTGNAVVQSTETGTAYLVKTTVSVSNLASITGAANNQQNSVTISSASTNTNLAATGLVDGTYKVYAVDALGNLSSASSNSVTVDTTAPTLTFNPLDNVEDVLRDVNITITFSESVRKIDDSELTNSNIGSHITLKLNNVNGNNIDFAATINGDKTVITIDPTSNLPVFSKDVYVAIGATVEDSAGNPITASTATFETEK
jgi:hypothetical protein